MSSLVPLTTTTTDDGDDAFLRRDFRDEWFRFDDELVLIFSSEDKAPPLLATTFSLISFCGSSRFVPLFCGHDQVALGFTANMLSG